MMYVKKISYEQNKQLVFPKIDEFQSSEGSPI